MTTWVYRDHSDFFPLSAMHSGNFQAGIQEPLQLYEGLFYRDRTYPHLAQLISQATLDEDFGQLPIDAYQAWNETGWKKQQASYAATGRLQNKAVEEYEETMSALYEFRESGEPAHFVEELGDYLWVVTAIANNGGAVLSDSARTRFFEHAAGTRILRSGKPDYPVWYNTLAQLPLQREPISIGNIDQLIKAGFRPQISPCMNLDEEDEEGHIDAAGYAHDLLAFVVTMVSINERQYNYGEGQVIPNEFGLLAKDLGVVVVEATLRVAALAHFAGSTLADVVQTNVGKITQRIENHTVDKADGERDTNGSVES